MDNYKEKTEQLMLDMIKQKEEADKRLLNIEILVGALCLVIFISLTNFTTCVEI